jgi:hypothetical protein
LRRADNVSLIYHATVLEIETAPEANIVTALKVGTLGGRRFRVEARSFVLATGGLENARLLLLSDRHRPIGLGNDNDQVGRYFMEHLHFTFGLAILRWPRRQLERLYSPDRRRAVARIFAAPELQREHELLNGNVMLYPAIRAGTARWRRAVRRPLERLHGGVMVRLAHTIEQPPNPASRLTLGAERDAFGLRRIRLDWRVGVAEQRTFQRNWRAFGHAIESARLGTVKAAPGDDEEEWPPAALQGQRGHHMGTTRMSANSKDGVVDADCCVHGIANLFVAGSFGLSDGRCRHAHADDRRVGDTARRAPHVRKIILRFGPTGLTQSHGVWDRRVDPVSYELTRPYRSPAPSEAALTVSADGVHELLPKLLFVRDLRCRGH